MQRICFDWQSLFYGFPSRHDVIDVPAPVVNSGNFEVAIFSIEVPERLRLRLSILQCSQGFVDPKGANSAKYSEMVHLNFI